MSRRRHRAARNTGSRREPGGGAGDEAPPLSSPAAGAAPAAAAPLPGGGAVTSTWTPREVVLPAPQEAENGGAPASAFETVLRLPLGRLAPLFSCFTSGEARPLRLLSRSAEAHVASTPFADMVTPVTDLATWRACFPRATALKLSPAVDWDPSAADFLAGLTALDASCVDTPAFLIALRHVPVSSSLQRAVLTGCPCNVCVELLLDAPPPLVAAAHAALRAAKGGTFTSQQLKDMAASISLGLSPEVAFARLDLLAGMVAHEKDAALVQAVVDAGVIGRTISSLRAFKGHAGAAGAAALLLFNLLQRDRAYATAVAQAGPAPASVAAMEAHHDNPAVVANACALLFNLPPLAPSTTRVLLACGAPSVVLRAIRACLLDTTCVANAIALLGELLRVDPPRAAAAIFSVPGAVDTHFAALAALVSKRPAAVQCMYNLTKLPDGGRAVGAAVRGGGVVALVAAADAHPSDAAVLRVVATLLSYAAAPIADNLCGQHGIDVRPLIAAGAPRALLAAVAAPHAASTTLLPFACETLQFLILGAAQEASRVLSTTSIVATLAAALAAAAAAAPPLSGEHLRLPVGVLLACVLTAPEVALRQLAQKDVLAALAVTLRGASGELAYDTLQLHMQAALVDAPAVASACSGALVEGLAAATGAHDAKVTRRALELMCMCSGGGARAVAALVAAGAASAVSAAVAAPWACSKGASAGAVVLRNMAEAHAGDVTAAGGAAALLRSLEAHAGSAADFDVILEAVAVLASGAPGCLAQHVAAVGRAAVAALGVPAPASFETPLKGLVIASALLHSGGATGGVAAALAVVRPALKVAVGAATAAMVAPHTPPQEAWLADKIVANSLALSVGVACYASEHPEVAGQLAGW